MSNSIAVATSVGDASQDLLVSSDNDSVHGPFAVLGAGPIADHVSKSLLLPGLRTAFQGLRVVQSLTSKGLGLLPGVIGLVLAAVTAAMVFPTTRRGSQPLEPSSLEDPFGMDAID